MMQMWYIDRCMIFVSTILVMHVSTTHAYLLEMAESVLQVSPDQCSQPWRIARHTNKVCFNVVAILILVAIVDCTRLRVYLPPVPDPKFPNVCS